MQQPFLPTIRTYPFTGERESKHGSIRTPKARTPQLFPDNAYLTEEFKDLCLTDVLSVPVLNGIADPKRNMERLIRSAALYLEQYGAELPFSPCGEFGHDMKGLINRVRQLLPENQWLNVDYIKDELVFIVYQSNQTRCWNTICYIPVSIAKTMRPAMRKFFFRFIAYMKQQNRIPLMTDNDYFGIYLEDYLHQAMEEGEDMGRNMINMIRSYRNKTGEAHRYFSRIDRQANINPDALLDGLKQASRKSKSAKESEQIACMIRGMELMSRDSLMCYTYNDTYDDYYCEDEPEIIPWTDLITLSWGVDSNDPVVKDHFFTLNEECSNMGVTEPLSCLILSPDKQEQLPPCSYPFEWLDYLNNDYFKYLVEDE